MNRFGPLIAVFLLAFACAALPQTAERRGAEAGPGASAPKAPTSAAATAILAAQDPKQSPEFRILSEQNSIIRAYQSSLLSTVYWALGFLATAATLIVGASWLVNFKIYEADKERLIEKFESRLREIQGQLATEIANARTESATAMADARTETLTVVQQQQEAAAQRLSQELIALRTEHKGAIAEINSSLEGHGKATSEIGKRLDKLKSELARLETIGREAEALAWEAQGAFGAAFITVYQALDTAIDAGREWHVRGVLERMREILTEHFINPGKKLDKGVISRARGVVKRAEKTPASFFAFSKRLRSTVSVSGWPVSSWIK